MAKKEKEFINPIDPDKVAINPGLLPYAHSAGGAVIRPEDKGRIKGNAMTAMYALLGICINKFAATPDLIAPLFDLQTIRDLAQNVFTGALAAAEDHSIFQHKMEDTDELLLENTGASVVNFYFSINGIAGAKTYTVITLQPMTNQTVHRSDMGDLANHFLHAVNPDAVAGSFKVTLLG